MAVDDVWGGLVPAEFLDSAVHRSQAGLVTSADPYEPWGEGAWEPGYELAYEDEMAQLEATAAEVDGLAGHQAAYEPDIVGYDDWDDGSGDEEPEYVTDWDSIWDGLGDHLHRGINVVLPPAVHAVVHDPTRPEHERAAALAQHLQQRPYGTHWTANPEMAEEFATVRHPNQQQATPVRVTVHKPGREWADEDADSLSAGQTFDFGDSDEAEVPLRDGAPLQLHSLSWGDHGGYHLTHHAAGPELSQLQHTAAQVHQAAEHLGLGHLDLYHRTTPEAAAEILRSRTMRSRENTGEAYFSTFRGDEPDAQASGYGQGVVHVRVPERLAEIDDEFPSGEKHYRVDTRALRPEHFVAHHAAVIREAADTAPQLTFEHQPAAKTLLARHPDGSLAGSVNYHDLGGTITPWMNTAWRDGYSVEDPAIQGALRTELARQMPDRLVHWPGDLKPRPDLAAPRPGERIPEGLEWHEETGERPGAGVLRATHQGQPVGYLQWTPGHGGGSVVDMVSVHPDWQRRGVATGLWDRASGIAPGLRHSDVQTPDGMAWAEAEELRRQAALVHEAAENPFDPEVRRRRREQVEQLRQQRLADPPPIVRGGDAGEVYRREHDLRQMAPLVPLEASSVQHLLHRVWKDHGMRAGDSPDDVGVEVRSDGGTKANPFLDRDTGIWGMSLHPSMADELTVLHEAAHVIAQGGRMSHQVGLGDNDAGHGDEFLRHYRRLVHTYARPEVGEEFDRTFHPDYKTSRVSGVDSAWGGYREAAVTPVTVQYMRSREKLPRGVEGFGRDVEPRGRYLTERDPSVEVDPDRWETGEVTFVNPLRVPFGGGYDEPDNWKRVLSDRFGGATGRALSDALVAAGHDGVITHDRYGTSEIVDLTHLRQTAAAVHQAANEMPAIPSRTFDQVEEETGGTKWPTKVTLRAHVGDQQVGFLRYLTNRRGTKVLVDTLQVHPDHQRRGHASALMDELHRIHAGPIDHGDRTNAGRAWWDSYAAGRPVSRGRVRGAGEVVAAVEPRTAVEQLPPIDEIVEQRYKENFLKRPDLIAQYEAMTPEQRRADRGSWASFKALPVPAWRGYKVHLQPEHHNRLVQQLQAGDHEGAWQTIQEGSAAAGHPGPGTWWAPIHEDHPESSYKSADHYVPKAWDPTTPDANLRYDHNAVGVLLKGQVDPNHMRPGVAGLQWPDDEPVQIDEVHISHPRDLTKQPTRHEDDPEPKPYNYGYADDNPYGLHRLNVKPHTRRMYA